MRLENKVAVITGCSRGIGESIATTFAREGADLVLIDILEERMENVKKQCEALGARVLAIACDITDEENVKKTAEKAVAFFGRIDILVNNAGIYMKGPEDLIDPEGTWEFINTKTSTMRRMLDVNVMGTIYVTEAFLPTMIAQDYGKIVNLGSVTGMVGKANMAEYSATKGAIIALTYALSKELAANHIYVNCISPGSILVEGRTSPKTFLDRPGYPEDIANAALYLASDESNFVIGQNLAVDGGRTLSLKC